MCSKDSCGLHEKLIKIENVIEVKSLTVKPIFARADPSADATAPDSNMVYLYLNSNFHQTPVKILKHEYN